MRPLWIALSVVSLSLPGCVGAHGRTSHVELPDVVGEARSPGSEAAGDPAAEPTADARPPAPSPSHVWVPGRWRAERERAVWVPGHWLAPRGRGSLWVSGHWDERGGRRIWVEGRWE